MRIEIVLHSFIEGFSWFCFIYPCCCHCLLSSVRSCLYPFCLGPVPLIVSPCPLFAPLFMFCL